MRRHNLGTLLGHVHHRGSVSRAELTSRMQLNRSTIAGLVSELEGLGVVEQQAPVGSRSGAGRPSHDVRPGPREVYALAVELRVDQITGARVGLGGRVLTRATVNTPPSRGPEVVADVVLGLLRLLTDQAPSGSSLVGVGVAVPGAVDSADGLVVFAPNLGWTEVPFAELLSARLRAQTAPGVPVVPVTVGNDADLGAVAEHTRGAGVDHDTVVYLSGDVGVGGGVMIDGHPMQGVGGYAGEIGHMLVDPGGRTCRCGNRGCWETEIGTHSIAAALGCAPDDLTTLTARLEAVVEPPEQLREVGRRLGAGLGSIINIFNPEVIICGGMLRAVYNAVGQDVDAAMRGAALEAPFDRVSVVLPGLGADSVLLGAAERAFAALLDDPVEVLTSAVAETA